jgi:hypothetical protein
MFFHICNFKKIILEVGAELVVYKELKTHQRWEPGRAQVPCVTRNFKIPKL